MQLTINVDNIQDDDVHIIATVSLDGAPLGRRVYEKHQLINEVDNLEYEIRKAVREVIINNPAMNAADLKTEIEKTDLTVRG